MKKEKREGKKADSEEKTETAKKEKSEGKKTDSERKEETAKKEKSEEKDRLHREEIGKLNRLLIHIFLAHG